jgi:hypothetical protein
MSDERFARLPKIIETPKLGDAATTDRHMLERLRGYVVGAPGPEPAHNAALPLAGHPT